MINVYVWLPKTIGGQKNVGHASMLVGGHTYVSWWPDEAAGFGRDFHPIRNKGFGSDVRDEGCGPDSSITIDGLDEGAITGWWSSFGLVRGGQLLQGPLPPYNLRTQNCSTVVARGLKLAGGDQYASWYASHSIIWRPQTVLDYASSIQRELARRASPTRQGGDRRPGR
jgi:hypothetical protein